MINKSLLALLSLLFATGAFANEPVILAVVNGDTITADAILDELMDLHSQQTEQVTRPNFDLNKLLQSLINDRLLVQDALALGMDQEATTLDAVRWFRETNAYELLLSDLAPSNFEIPEDEIRAGFERLYRRVQSRMICVVDSHASAALADSIRMGIPMASLATRHAVDRYKDFGGDAGTHPLFDVSEDLADQYEDNPLGTLIGPISLWGVWVITRAENFLPADEVLYDSVKTLVRRHLLLEKGEHLRRDLIAREGATIPVRIDSVKVDSILVMLSADQAGREVPVVTVGKDRILSQESLYNKFVHRYVGRTDRQSRTVLNEVLDEQVQTMMLREIATRNNYVNDPRLDADALAFRDSMLVVAYLQTVIAPTVKVTDQEIRAHYDQNLEKYRLPGRVRIAVITRATQEEAVADYDKILAGADFSWIAEKYSIDNFASSGGIRDWISLDQFPRFMSERLDTMQLGNCIPPLQGNEGFVVMKLVERERGEIMPFDDAKGRIKAMLNEQKQFAAIDQTLSELREQSEIVVNQDAINSFRPPMEEE